MPGNATGAMRTHLKPRDPVIRLDDLRKGTVVVDRSTRADGQSLLQMRTHSAA